MISEENVREILHATLLYNELYKKTLQGSFPACIKTKTQMDILFVLYARGAMNMRTLSSHLSIAPEQTTRAIKTLSENDLVVSQRNPDNLREVIAQVTSKGKQLIKDHMEDLHQRLEACLFDLDEKELEAFEKASHVAVDILSTTNFGSGVIHDRTTNQ